MTVVNEAAGWLGAYGDKEIGERHLNGPAWLGTVRPLYCMLMLNRDHLITEETLNNEIDKMTWPVDETYLSLTSKCWYMGCIKMAANVAGV